MDNFKCSYQERPQNIAFPRRRDKEQTVTKQKQHLPGADFGCFLKWFDLIKRTYSMYSDRQTLANRVDPNQTSQKAASDQGLQCLPLNQQFDTLIGSNVDLLKRSIR